MDSHSYMCSETETREHWSTISSPSVQPCLGLTCDTCVSHFKDEGFPLLNLYRKLPSTYTPDTSRFTVVLAAQADSARLWQYHAEGGTPTSTFRSRVSGACMHIAFWSDLGTRVVTWCYRVPRVVDLFYWPQIPTFSPDFPTYSKALKNNRRYAEGREGVCCQ